MLRSRSTVAARPPFAREDRSARRSSAWQLLLTNSFGRGWLTRRRCSSWHESMQSVLNGSGLHAAGRPNGRPPSSAAGTRQAGQQEGEEGSCLGDEAQGCPAEAARRVKAVAGRGQRAGDGDGCTAEAVEGAQSRGEPRPGSCGREGLHTGRGCTAHAHAHTHLPMHLHMHPPLHLHTSHGCSRRRFRRCSWPAARGGSVAHVVAGWSTVGPPRELRCAACGKHFGAPSPGTGGPLPTGGGVTKVARSAPR